MQYNIDFGLSALFFMVLIYIFFHIQYSEPTSTSRAFKVMLLFTIVANALDIITAITISYPYSVSVKTNYYLNSLYYFSSSVCVYYVCEYTRIMANQKKGKLIDYINRALYFSHAVFCLTNPVTKLISYFDENRIYSKGPMYYEIYIIAVYFLLFSLFRVIKMRKMIGTKRLISTMGFFALNFSGLILQGFVWPHVLLEYFTASLGVMVLLYVYETPDYAKLIKTTDELKKNREMLEKSRKREEEATRTVHELMKSAYWSVGVNKEGGFEEAVWSDEFLHMLGYAEGEYQGKIDELWSNSLYSEDKDMALEAFWNGFQGEPYDTEFRLVGKNGDIRWYRATGELKYDEEGNLKSYQGIIIDIDDEKYKEALIMQRMQAIEELEKSQIHLREALLMAREASMAKTTFLSNMSHDIRTPMNAIVGFTNVALEHADDSAKVKECLETIKTSSNHLLRLINDVLDMSRIESGRLMIEKETSDIVQMLSDVGKMVQGDVEAHNLSYEEDYSGVVVRNIQCDRLRLNQILINCVGNSVKFTPDGGKITVKATQGPSEKENCNTYIISIKDTGIGMSKEFLKHIFEPFEREKKQKVDRTQGTGLGMAITKNLVEMMGGSIKVESELEKGTEYLITIPFEIADAEETEENSKEAKIPFVELKERLKGKNIAVVDDNEINRRIAQLIIEENGMNCILYESGDKLLEDIDDMESKEFDLICMDIQMPGINGYETADKIRAMKERRLSTVPIIAMTADAFEEDKRNAVTHGMNGHISKPINVEELIYMIYDLVETD